MNLDEDYVFLILFQCAFIQQNLVVGEGGVIDWISPGWRGEYKKSERVRNVDRLYFKVLAVDF